MRFALVGGGRVGASLAAWLVAAGGRAQAVGARPGSPRAAELARGLAVPLAPVGELSSTGWDLLLVAVADPALDEVARQLAVRPQAAVALHTAGGRGASALAPLAAAGTAIGTLHPLKAFPRPLTDPEEARGVFFALGGDPAAVALGRRIALAWDATAEVVGDAERTLYHFAATLAAGGVTTLVAAAQGLAARLGLPPAVAAGYLRLARGALCEAEATGGAAAAITGPAARGDLETVERQLAELATVDPALVPLAALLALAAARTTGAADRETTAALERRAAGFLDHPRGRC